MNQLYQNMVKGITKVKPAAEIVASKTVAGAPVMDTGAVLRDMDGSILTAPMPNMALAKSMDAAHQPVVVQPSSTKDAEEKPAESNKTQANTQAQSDDVSSLDSMDDLSGMLDQLPVQESAVSVDLRAGAESAAQALEQERQQNVAAQTQTAAVQQASSTPAPPAPAPARATASEANHSPHPAPQRAAPRPAAQGATNSRPQAMSLAERAKLEMKQVVSSAKTLTPLVMAVSQTPGVDSNNARAQLLNMLMQNTYKGTVDVVNNISEMCQRNMPSWMVATLMQSISNSIAQQWMQGNCIDAEKFQSDFVHLFEKNHDFLAKSVPFMSDTAYRAVDDEDRTIAQDRLMVSCVNASWTLYNAICSPRLVVDKEEPEPRYFTFNHPPEEVLQKLLKATVQTATNMQMSLQDVDSRISYMQSAVNRLAEIVANEYVAQAARTMRWIEVEGLSTEERAKRHQDIVQGFESHVIPRIIEWSRTNFLMIERTANSALEKIDVEQKIQRNVPH